MMAERPQPPYLLLGEILRPHGVRGELRMRVRTGYPEHLRELKTIYVARSPEAAEVRPYALQGVRLHQDYALLTVEGIADRDQADTMRGLYVLVDLNDAVPLEEDEIYLFQLIGMEVYTDEGIMLGVISDVLETGANDVYVVNGVLYGEVLIPVIDQTIISTDTDANRLTVKLPEGLLPA